MGLPAPQREGTQGRRADEFRPVAGMHQKIDQRSFVLALFETQM